MVMACIATDSFTHPPTKEGLEEAERILDEINMDDRDILKRRQIFSLALDQQTNILNIPRADVLRYCELMSKLKK